MTVFECSICCQDKNINFRYICPKCSASFCRECQWTYKKNECMNCHLQFKRSFMGKKFYEQIVKPALIEELMTEQKTTLKFVQPLADWEKNAREQRKKLRFGIRMTIPERPQLQMVTSVSSVFPCPIANCRGFVEAGLCGLCKKHICSKCHELCEATGHYCKIENLQTMALLTKDSRNCPKCCAVIFRTYGCNHMFCTNCRTHFDWETLKILPNSSNDHYLHLQRFSQNIPLRETPHESESTIPSCDQEFSLYRDGVPLESIDSDQIDPQLIRGLWTDSNAVRLIKRQKYHEPTITEEYANHLQELQIKYLLGDLEENNWKIQVYRRYQDKTLAILYGEVLDIYLSTVDLLQRLLDNSPSAPSASSNVLFQYTQLVDLCNQSFESIREDYGGSLHHIRSPNESINSPSIT